MSDCDNCARATCGFRSPHTANCKSLVLKDSYVSVPLTNRLLADRERMKENQPRVYAKLMKYLELGNNPDNPVCARLDWAISFQCNFRCRHCFATAFTREEDKISMPLDRIRYVANQADDLGVFMINLIGGEPLIWRGLDEIIQLLNPKRFRITITTNGWALSLKKAKHLASIGVDRVCVSIDSSIPEEHDAFRRVQGSHARAMEAVKNSIAAGMITQIATTVTHQNLYSEGITGLLKITNDLGAYIVFSIGAPCGEWLGNMNILIDENDAEYIRQLRKDYPLFRRDVFPSPGLQGGCFAVKQTLYIIPSGEVLPCFLIQSTLGNVFETPLREIRNRGLSLEPFKGYSEKCYAAEDREFIDKYISRTFTAKEFPLSFEEGWL